MVLDRDTAQRVLDNFVEEVVIGQGLYPIFCGAMVSVSKGADIILPFILSLL